VVMCGCDGCELLIAFLRRSDVWAREYYGMAVKVLRQACIPSTVANRVKRPRAGRRKGGATRSVAFPGGYLMFARPQGDYQPAWVHLEPEALHRDLHGTIQRGRTVLQTLYDEFHGKGDVRTGNDVALTSLTPHLDTDEWQPQRGIRACLNPGRCKLPISEEDYGDGRTEVKVAHGFGRFYAKDLEMRKNPDSAWLADLLVQRGWDGVSPLTRVEFTCARNHLPAKVRDLDAAWRYWTSMLTLHEPEVRIPGRRFRDRPVDPFWIEARAASFPSIGQSSLRQRTKTRLSDTRRLRQLRGAALAYLCRAYAMDGRPLGEPDEDVPALVSEWLRDAEVREAAVAKVRTARIQYGKGESA